MFGIDTWVSGLSDGGTLLVVAGVALLLGLRHATDPDHCQEQCSRLLSLISF